MVSLVCRRGFKSHRQETDEQLEGSSARPWTVTRMPAMVKVWAETAGEVGEVGEVPSRGLFVAAMVAFGGIASCVEVNR